MSSDSRFVDGVDELVHSVLRFMETPTLWREAVGNHPKYFVHYQHGARHCFGLSKFCAFRNLTMQAYLADIRYTTKGVITQQHISEITGQQWVPLGKVASPISTAFVSWFTGFFPHYDLNQISIISLGSGGLD
jgi:hypothetical protein